MLPPDQSLDITSLLSGYENGDFTPAEVIDLVTTRIDSQADHNIWITRLSADAIQPYLDRLQHFNPKELPLYGIPFGIKDNIDLANVPTTAGCPEYSYTSTAHASVVEQLIDAGAIPIGKTNLDQFATGLVGTRSPYGAGRNSFNPAYISGGSSSGSALAVALGQVSFALGTDTAGSGRVPAAFNNIVGLKPTRGLLSTRGVVPACRSLDCVSIFAVCAADAERVLNASSQFDPEDDYARPIPSTVPGFDISRFHFGVPRPEQLEFFGNDDGLTIFSTAVQKLESLGGEKVEIDFAPFLAAARLLYEGPWVTERYVAIEDFITEQPEALFPVTRAIISGGATPSAVAAFKAQYRLQHLRRQSELAWQGIEVLLTPTAGRHYTIDEVNADPIRLNSNLGYYTNFMNLLDLSAYAVPAGFQSDGLPFGVTLVGHAFHDSALLQLGDRLQRCLVTTQGATQCPLPNPTEPAGPGAGWTRVAVCGAHLSGLPLNHQLTERGGRLLQQTRTAPYYHLYALAGGPPQRPGLVRRETGAAIEIEIWALPLAEYGSFVAGIPAPLGIGTLETAEGQWVQGFLCEDYALHKAEEITHLGGWRAYVQACGCDPVPTLK
jgi:allophanate hydrolase